MGLMSWLRGGGRTETSTGAEAGSAGAAPPSPLRKRVDLSELSPIQRTLGTQDLVIDPSGFQGSLTTRQDASLGTPLGHLVSPDAPAGLVHGITAPAAPVTVDRPSPVQRTVERSAELPVGARSVPLSVPLSVRLAVPMQRVVPGDAPAMTSAGESAAAEVPVRQLVGEQTLVAASESASPEPAPPNPHTHPNPHPHPSPDPAPPVQRSVMPPAPGSARRAPGLGAPMSALPPTAQRQAAVEVTGAEPGGIPVARSGEDGGSGGGGEAPEAAQEPVAPASEPDSGGPTAPLLGDSPLLPAASDSTPQGSPTPAVQRTPAVPPQAPLVPPPNTAPVAPLLADRPVTLQNGRSGGPGAVQRSAVDGVVPSSPAGAGPMSVPGAEPVSLADAVPVRWTSSGAGAPSMAAATPSVPAALQRTVTAPGQGTGAPSPPLPALQRQAAGGPPVPRSLPGSGSRTAPSAAHAPSAPGTSFTSAGSVAVAAGVAQRMADGSVVFGSPSPPYSSPVVQREAETTEPPPPEPPPAPEPEPEPEPEPGPMAEDHGAPGAAASAPGAPPGQSGGHGGAGAPVVTDELVRALYTPLSRLFKADLRLERERAGFLINTRH
ncbi:hypothetical protein [Streptomyces atratus]|uniref:hypothetical protein n=1 Tax=Streptomyces atratus TaxID=1893 RepID=UPI0013005D1B|nr:hypothetical protein [Streptomyces atratus]